jgi:hypothetical protein
MVSPQGNRFGEMLCLARPNPGRLIELFGVLRVGHIQNRSAVLKGAQQHVHWARQANVSLGRFRANTSFPKARF